MLSVKRKNLTASFDGEKWSSNSKLVARMLNDNANPARVPDYLGTPEQRAAGLAAELGFMPTNYTPPVLDESVVY